VKRLSGAGLIPAIELIDPSGLKEDSAGAFDNAYGDKSQSLVERKLLRSGTYTLVVSGSGTGSYGVTLTLDRFVQVTSGAAVSGQIADPNQKDRYQLAATQGQQLVVRVARTGGIRLIPSITLVDPSGLKEDSAGAFDNVYGDKSQSLLQRRLASSGTYVIVVSGSGTGPYVISVAVQ